MKRWCPRGTMYSHMDALLECGAALTRGATVNGIHECPDCEMWHLGQRKVLIETCHGARKRIYGTEQAAVEALEKIRARREAGAVHRGEESVHRCRIPKGCGKWHLTSWEEGETRYE